MVHGPEDREDLPVSARNPVADALAFPSTAVKPRHLRRNPAFIDIDQVFRGDRGEGFEVSLALAEVLFGVALGGVE